MRKIYLVMITLAMLCMGSAVRAETPDYDEASVDSIVSILNTRMYDDGLTQCIANSATAEDRTDLVRWILSSLASHPAMSDMARISPDMRDSVARKAGQLFNRLLTQTCGQELKTAVQSEGEGAYLNAVKFLGVLAMQELMSNPQFIKGMTAMDKYVDQRTLDRMMRSD